MVSYKHKISDISITKSLKLRLIVIVIIICSKNDIHWMMATTQSSTQQLFVVATIIGFTYEEN